MQFPGSDELEYDPYLFQGFSQSSNNGMSNMGSFMGNTDSTFDPSSLLASEIRGPKDNKSSTDAKPEKYVSSIVTRSSTKRKAEKNTSMPGPSSGRSAGTKRNLGTSHGNKQAKKSKSKPGQPRPPGCEGKTLTSLKLVWKPPKDSGGFPVDAYQLQKREFVNDQQSRVPLWTDLFPKLGYENTAYELKGLRPGSLTQFRVKAHNKVGWGKFSRPSDPFPTESNNGETKSSKIEGTLDPAMIEWDVPKIRLGRGAFGVVYRSAIGGYRGTTVAVKIERNVQAYGDKTEDEKEKLQSWLREVQILSSLRHPNLVLFMGACQCDGRLYILTEYMSGGSLENAVYRPLNPLRDRQWIQSILAQVASAMEYLHSNNPRITHRDLKPANVLLDKTWVHAKVCDFGFARMHKKEVMSTLTKFAGTTPYMAPEALGEEDNVSAKVDVYSFGVMAAEALIQERPFPNYSNAEVMKAVCIRNERPYALENKGLGPVEMLIKDCWHSNPDSRPAFATVIKHLAALGWFK
mmetsp:Transcript_35080/g.67879  ORF Transcript_35080/g.67879 Transcript_35080/m.67879 type:complete len:519 (-) Transcript_35080:209-1765(-)